MTVGLFAVVLAFLVAYAIVTIAWRVAMWNEHRGEPKSAPPDDLQVRIQTLHAEGVEAGERIHALIEGEEHAYMARHFGQRPY